MERRQTHDGNKEKAKKDTYLDKAGGHVHTLCRNVRPAASAAGADKISPGRPRWQSTGAVQTWQGDLGKTGTPSMAGLVKRLQPSWRKTLTWLP